MLAMRYPVRVYEVKVMRGHAGPPPKPELVQEFEVRASNLEAVRKLVVHKLEQLGKEMRSLSFSPSPEPTGSVVVYVKSNPRKRSSMVRQARPNPIQPKKRRRS